MVRARLGRAATRRAGAARRRADAAAPRLRATHTSQPPRRRWRQGRLPKERRARRPQAAPGGAQRPRGDARRSPPSTPVGMRSSCSTRESRSPARRTRWRWQIPAARAHARRFELRAQAARQLPSASSGLPGPALTRPAPARSTRGRGQPRRGHAPQAHRRRAGLTHL